jgi:hypothetical protein
MSSRPPSDDGIPIDDNVVIVDFTRGSKENRTFPLVGLSASNLHKLKVFEDLLKQGTTALVLDASSIDVKVPLDLKDVPNLRLNFSHRYGIADFAYDESGVKATLSFPEGFYFCMIPWKAVFIIELDSTGMGAVWREDVPSILKSAFELKKETRHKKSFKTQKKSASFLRLVTDD